MPTTKTPETETPVQLTAEQLRIAQLEEELRLTREAAEAHSLTVAEQASQIDELRKRQPQAIAEAAPEPAEPRLGKPAEQGGYFTRADCFKHWRVLARNPVYTGETEGFGFSNGQAIVPALPASASEVRITERIRKLNNLRGYDQAVRFRDARGQWRTRFETGYRILTEEQYEAEFGGATEEDEELPPDL